VTAGELVLCWAVFAGASFFIGYHGARYLLWLERGPVGPWPKCAPPALCTWARARRGTLSLWRARTVHGMCRQCRASHLWIEFWNEPLWPGLEGCGHRGRRST
jgi:hypothetical protein